MRLDPRDPNIADHFRIIGSAQNLLGHADQAIGTLEAANAGNPWLSCIHLQLAAAYGQAQCIDDPSGNWRTGVKTPHRQSALDR